MSIKSNEIAAPPIWQTDPARVRAVGIVQGTRFVVAEQGSGSYPLASIAVDEPIFIEEAMRSLVREALDRRCASVWIVPPHTVELDWLAAARVFLLNPGEELRAHPLTNPKSGSMIGLVAQRARGGMPLSVFFVDAGSGDAWNIAGECKRADPVDIAIGVFAAARLLGMQLRFSPSYCGLQLMRQELAAKSYAIPPLSDNTRALVSAHLPTYLQWKRTIAPEEAASCYPGLQQPICIYKYDRNSSFIASAGEVPVGEPMTTTEFVKGRPGLYRLRAWQHGEDGERGVLPGLFHMGEGAGEYPWGILDGVWAWEPQIRLAQKLGIPLAIEEGYYWPHSHDLFRSWRERIWKARTTAEAMTGTPGRIAKSIIKAVGVQAIGRLKQKIGHAVMPTDEAEARGLRVLHYELDEQGDFSGLAEVIDELGKTDLVRPDWWATIIANANERAFAAAYAQRASVPVAGYVDAWYCLREWPAEAIEPQRLGKWKTERVIPISPEELDELNACDTAALWVKRLAAFYRAGTAGSGELDDGEEDD